MGSAVAVVVNDQLNSAASGAPSPRALTAVVAVIVYVFERSSGASAITVAVDVALLYWTAAAACVPSWRRRMTVDAFKVAGSIGRENVSVGLASVPTFVEPSRGVTSVTAGGGS